MVQFFMHSRLCKNPNMMELMVPFPLSKREQECAEQVAARLDLLTELVCWYHVA